MMTKRDLNIIVVEYFAEDKYAVLVNRTRVRNACSSFEQAFPVLASRPYIKLNSCEYFGGKGYTAYGFLH